MTQNRALQVFKGGWEQLEHAVFTDNEGNIPNFPVSYFIRPDGSSVSSIDGTAIETYPIGLPFWDPTQVGSIADTFTIPDDITPIGHCWNDNGTRLYVVGQNNKELFQYTVPTPYLPSSIVAASVSLDLVDVANDPIQVVISRDGDFIFITDGTSVYSFPLPVKDDITSNTSNTVFTPGGGVFVDTFAVKREGDKIYTGDTADNSIREYVTTAPNIIVGATFNGNTLNLTSDPVAHFTFRPNGKEIHILEDIGGFKRCHADDAWDLSSASLFSNTFAAVDSQSLVFKPDDTLFFSLVQAGDPNDRIDQFALLNRGNITNANLVDNFSLDGIANTPRGIWVTPDGFVCVVMDAATDDLVRLNMSTGWNLGTMTNPSIRFDLGAAVGVTNPSGVAFTKDQLTYYIADAGTDSIYQLTVPSPMDIANSVDTGNVLNLTGMGDVTDVRLKPDDKLMYVSVRAPDRILLFRLPADGNVSNAVFLVDLNVEAQEDNLQAFFIRENDGKKLWVAGIQSGVITCMDMTLEFNNAITTELGEDLSTDAGETIVYA